MSNFARAVKALNDVDDLYGSLMSNEDYVTILQGRGLLSPDLPEPDVVKLNGDIKYFVGTGKQVRYDKASDRIQVMVSDPLLSSEARELAHALLAAANHAEKEQGND